MKTRSKKVHWAKEVKERTGSKKQLAFFEKSLSKEKLFNRLRKKVEESIKLDDYRVFDQYLEEKKVNKAVLNQFYKHDSMYCMFEASINIYLINGPLMFFLQKLSEQQSKYLLEYKNNQALKTFLYLQKFSKEEGRYTEEKKLGRTERLFLLLKMNDEVVTNFMQKPEVQSLISDDVRLEYQTALAQFQQENNTGGYSHHGGRS